MNKKTKFFKNVLILQFIPILFLGILILSNFREQKTLKIKGLHPYEFNYGFAVPLLIFGIGLVLSLLSLFLKQENDRQDEAEGVKVKRKQNFWKFAFYCNVFFVCVIAIFSAVIFREDSIVIDQPVLFYSSIVLRASLVVLISVVVASFFLATGINWKTNKMLAVIILIFSFFIIGISIFGDVLFMKKFNDASESYKMAKSEKIMPSESEEEVGDYDGYVNYEESEEGEESNSEESEENQESEYGPSEEVKKLQSLVLDKSTVVDSWNAMRDDFFVKKIGTSADLVGLRMYVYSVLAGQTYDNDYRVLNLISRLRNRPVQLYDGLESYKWILFSTVSKETYRSNQFDHVVDALLFTYHDVGEDAGKLNKIYEIMQNNIDSDENNIGKFLPEIKKVCSPYAIKKLSKNEGFYKSNSDIVWFYSFWARRSKEGNIDKVYMVLREIQEHYI
ncbi:hypothetical protein IUY40_06030 [Flavobacterium sp. ALJ2]|uniref:hypothetical protein n=1 Tax=Flavobacterium sp. ALJ2 TaxID=2786960 RepID=UPI00189D1268|nr:hypothetical protein [Flavobacterium sp. ALJ2]MBF7091093.1 hypothetical protein [Flavobacterium sp. ALJ2]